MKNINKGIKSEPPMTILKGVGEKRASQYARLGIKTPKNLLTFYPKTYEDWTNIVSIAEASFDEPSCIKVKPVGLPSSFIIRKGLVLYKFQVTDDESIMDITIFNNKYAAEKIKMDKEYLFYGKVSGRVTRREMNSPLIEYASTGKRIRPIYPQTEGLTTRMIENAVSQALKMHKIGLSKDPLPEGIITKHNLVSKEYATKNIHFPETNDALEKSRKRLAFEELFVLQLGLLQLRSRNRNRNKSIVENDYTKDFIKLLPYQLTNAQIRIINECLTDMSGDTPMNRLVQGDVGSGKTAVAAGVSFSAIKNGYQVAMMAPTEILAGQHVRSLSDVLSPAGINVGLLTGSMSVPNRRDVLSKLESGEIHIVVGTHALISETVVFNNLALVITDEQHRFGVKQRGKLALKGKDPHTLVMSATPIPRTLALIVYGDLDVSVLDELPPGRTPISTYVIDSGKRERAFNYIKKHIAKNLQGYIVCPLVEDPEEESDLASATEYAQNLLATSFKGYRLGLLHGKMKSTDKEAVMDAFTNNKISLLVSTTVIEVGVDVENAVIILIENAERFGLAQLHQLRGRVGRGKVPSACILISDAQNEEALARLKVMTSTTDGFKIADEDLKLRGPGDFFGRRQHGLPDLKIASLAGGDMELFRQAQEEARELLSKDPDLNEDKHSLLASLVKSLFDQVGEEGMN